MNLSELIMRDTRSNQPDPGIVGRLYCVTDEDSIIERDNGVAWESYTASVSVPPTHNFIVNSGFDWWQRQTGTTASGAKVPGTLQAYADDAYCADQWYNLTDGGSTDVQFAQTSGSGDIDTGYEYGCKIKQTNASAKFLGVAQIIEYREAIKLRSKEIIFQIRAKGSGASNIKVAILGWAGTANTVTSDIVKDWSSSTYTPDNFFISTVTVIGASASSSISTSYSSITISGTAPADCNNIIVFVWTTAAVAQNFELYLAKAGLYEGNEEQTWSLNNLADEYQRCCRFYYLVKSSSSWNYPNFVREGPSSAAPAYHYNMILPCPMLGPSLGYEVQNGMSSNVLHKPQVSWDTISSFTMAIDSMTNVRFDLTPTTNNTGSYSCYPYGVRIWLYKEL